LENQAERRGEEPAGELIDLGLVVDPPISSRSSITIKGGGMSGRFSREPIGDGQTARR
jgi:hypothetical protein